MLLRPQKYSMISPIIKIFNLITKINKYWCNSGCFMQESRGLQFIRNFFRYRNWPPSGSFRINESLLYISYAKNARMGDKTLKWSPNSENGISPQNKFFRRALHGKWPKPTGNTLEHAVCQGKPNLPLYAEMFILVPDG